MALSAVNTGDVLSKFQSIGIDRPYAVVNWLHDHVCDYQCREAYGGRRQEKRVLHFALSFPTQTRHARRPGVVHQTSHNARSLSQLLSLLA